MAGYSKIDGEALAYDERVESLSDTAYRLLHFLWHGPGRTMIGARRFHPRDALARNPHWTLTQTEVALQELVACGLAFYDPERAICFTPLAMEHQPPAGLKVCKGAASRLADLPESPALVPAFGPILQGLREAALSANKQEQRRELEQMVQGLRARLERIRKANPEPEPEHTDDAQEQTTPAVPAPGQVGGQEASPLPPALDIEPAMQPGPTSQPTGGNPEPTKPPASSQNNRCGKVSMLHPAEAPQAGSHASKTDRVSILYSGKPPP